MEKSCSGKEDQLLLNDLKWSSCKVEGGGGVKRPRLSGCKEPQTSDPPKTQAHGCLENSDLPKIQTLAVVFSTFNLT